MRRLDDGELTDEALAVPATHLAGITPGARFPEFQRALAGSSRLNLVLSDVDDARVHGTAGTAPAGTRIRPVLWAGIRAEWTWADGDDAPPVPVAIVAALNLGDALDRINRSPRHVAFVTQGEQFVLHPLPEQSLAAGSGVADGLRRDRFFQSAGSDSPDAGQSVLEAGFRELEAEQGQDRETVNQLRRVGLVRLPEVPLGPDVSIWYRQTEKIAEHPEADALIARVNTRLDPLQSGIAEYGPLARIGRLNKTIGRIRIRAGSREELDRLSQHISQDLSEYAGFEADWDKRVECRNFALHFFKLRYDPHDASRWLGLIQGVAREEIEAEARSEMSGILFWATGALAVVVAVALAFTLGLTRPLERMTRIARRVSESDLRSQEWQQELSAATSRLPVRRKDEIGVLAVGFQQMMDEIGRANAELREERNLLDRRVEDRTAELRQMNQDLLIARDQAEAANRATEAFVAAVSHELRTPLNHIMGFCQLMELSELDAQQREDLTKISGAGKYLLSLVNDILDYQRIVMGVVRLEPEEFELQPLVEELAAAMELKARENGNRIVVECGGVGAMYSDQKRVRQILLNLLSNACKFTQDGTVTVAADRHGRNGREWITLSVADTGRGMTPEEQDKLFRPFAKLADRQGNKDGTGLGLVITKGFAERMGGAITFDSELGRGTTFRVELPARLAAGEHDGDGRSEPPAPADWQAGVPRPGQRNPGASGRRAANRVLVVDDDPNIRDLMTRFLEQRGFEIRTAASGEEGLQLAKELHPAVITLDVVMPGMDGWELLAALKTSDRTADIPVVIVSMLDDRPKGFSLGVADYLVKPVEWDQLSGVLEKYGCRPGEGNSVVLVIDDDPAVREYMRRVLQDDGWTVIEAEHGQAGLERLRETRPALILLDLMMPVMDGFEFVEEVQRDPRLASIPILVLTAKDPTAEDRQRLNGGVKRILHKGAHEREEVLEQIHGLIARTVGPPATVAAAVPEPAPA
ncbi:MAG TPA: response regulator [Planctomycetaceae bacterium]|nr:response regulator [Planctomycetaceae bacterium]